MFIRLLLFLLFPPLLFSCAPKISTPHKPDYNDSVNRQFWTAHWSPDDRFIAVGGVDSVLRIYRSQNLRLHRAFPVNSWIHSVKWNPRDDLLAIATLDKYVLLLNPASGKRQSLGKTGGSRAIGWNYNGEMLAVADLNGVVSVWSKTGQLLHRFAKPYDPDQAGTGYLGLDWHPSENIFVAANFEIHVFDSTAKELQVMKHANPAAIILSMRWHPSGDFFVVGDYGHNWEGENVPSLLHFWSAKGHLLQSVSGSKGPYRNMDWNATGTRLATASDVLRIWDRSGKLLSAGPADSSNYLWGVAWNKKGDRVVTASRHKTIALWDSNAVLLRRIDLLKKPGGD
jgi:WD40 repeat protein